MRRPQPTLDDVATLILESRQAGTSVGFDMRLARRDAVPDATGRTAYRIVQEGLTNARKHQPGGTVDVEIDDDGSALTVSIVSRPPDRDSSPAGARRAGAATALAQTPGTGTGLIGLAERVALADGALDHGPDRRRRLRPDRCAPGGPVTAPVRVLIVDDDALVRSGLRMMLSGGDRVEVVAEAADGSEALAAVDAHRPDVVLMDLRMPKVDGLEATQLVRGQPSPPHVLVLTTFDADELVLRALRAGADGFLLKDTEPAEILRAIELVSVGEAILSPTVAPAADRPRRRRGRRRRRSPRRRAPRLSELTERELEVARAVGQGKSNVEIANDLYMSVSTVKAHVTHVLAKLEVDNRVQVALLVNDAER